MGIGWEELGEAVGELEIISIFQKIKKSYRINGYRVNTVSISLIYLNVQKERKSRKM